MLKEEYLQNISFIRLKRKMYNDGYNPQTLEKALNKRISYSTIRNSINGNFIMTTQSLVILAAFFRCSVDYLVQFIGYEKAPEFKKHIPEIRFIEREPDPDFHISYEPLYSMFKEKYGDNYINKMELFFDRVENIEMTSKQKEHTEVIVKIAKDKLEEKRKQGLVKGEKAQSRRKSGLSVYSRN